jgi:hypothetical protein
MACVSSPFHSSHRIRDEFGAFFSLPHRRGYGLGGFNGLGWSRSLRGHRVGLEEFLEEWYDRSAEACNLFVNISEVDKYCVACTVCQYFEKECCSTDPKGSSILSMVNAAYHHDGLPQQ